MLMKIVRSRAWTKGWSLNEYGMGQRETIAASHTRKLPIGHTYHALEIAELILIAMIKAGTEILVKNEEEIFAKLDLPYLPVSIH